jgi:tRNA dimethylallyltransferase
MSLPIIVIAGPTGSGKTATAVNVALAVGGEVVTADSMQVYRGMDIGTAKPTPAEQRGVPHHLIDVAAPDDPFTVAHYVVLADAVIAGIAARGRVPIVAGGTGFYISALVDRLQFPPAPDDTSFRDALAGEDPAALHARLAAIDLAAAARLHPNDVKRVVRALEIFHLTGRTQSSFEVKPAADGPYAAQWWGLRVARDVLHDRLARRVHEQLDAGLFEEVRALHEAGYAHTLPSMKGITYRQLLGHLRGEYDFPTAVELMIRDNRRYARRQYTWFNADPRIRWIDMDAEGAVGAAGIIADEWRAQ